MYQLFLDDACVYDKAAEGGHLPVASELCARLARHLAPRPGEVEAWQDDVDDEPAVCTWAPPQGAKP